jgi:hypothetical protein
LRVQDSSIRSIHTDLLALILGKLFGNFQNELTSQSDKCNYLNQHNCQMLIREFHNARQSLQGSRLLNIDNLGPDITDSSFTDLYCLEHMAKAVDVQNILSKLIKQYLKWWFKREYPVNTDYLIITVDLEYSDLTKQLSNDLKIISELPNLLVLLISDNKLPCRIDTQF